MHSPGETLGKPFTRAEMDAIRKAARDEERVVKGFWPALKRIARNVPFAEDLVASYLCAVDPATSKKVKLVLFGALAYFVIPSDAIPDILPLVGFTDDAAVLATALATVRAAVKDTHYQQARQILADESDA